MTEIFATYRRPLTGVTVVQLNGVTPTIPVFRTWVLQWASSERYDAHDSLPVPAFFDYADYSRPPCGVSEVQEEPACPANVDSPFWVWVLLAVPPVSRVFVILRRRSSKQELGVVGDMCTFFCVRTALADLN